MRGDRSFVRDIAIAGTILLCLVVAGIIRAARKPAPEEETRVVAEEARNLDGQTQELINVENRPERKPTRQVVLEEIDKHKQKIAEDPKDEEVPAYQLAIANLYVTKLGDYEAASIQLEELIEQFPDSDLAAQAYAKLAKCYEGLGWRGVADATYKRMMEHFPDDSASHQYARAKRSGAENIY